VLSSGWLGVETGGVPAVWASAKESVVVFSVDAPEVQAPADGTVLDVSERVALDELGAPARIELIRSLFSDATVRVDARGRAIRFSLPYG
jgi:hypothetical protein